MSHVKFAISPARNPALTDNKTIDPISNWVSGALGEGEEIANVFV